MIEGDVPALPDPGLDAIVRAALAKDPAARLASATEMALLKAVPAPLPPRSLGS